MYLFCKNGLIQINPALLSHLPWFSNINIPNGVTNEANIAFIVYIRHHAKPKLRIWIHKALGLPSRSSHPQKVQLLLNCITHNKTHELNHYKLILKLSWKLSMEVLHHSNFLCEIKSNVLRYKDHFSRTEYSCKNQPDPININHNHSHKFSNSI